MKQLSRGRRSLWWQRRGPATTYGRGSAGHYYLGVDLDEVLEEHEHPGLIDPLSVSSRASYGLGE